MVRGRGGATTQIQTYAQRAMGAPNLGVAPGITEAAEATAPEIRAADAREDEEARSRSVPNDPRVVDKY